MQFFIYWKVGKCFFEVIQKTIVSVLWEKDHLYENFKIAFTLLSSQKKDSARWFFEAVFLMWWETRSQARHSNFGAVGTNRDVVTTGPPPIFVRHINHIYNGGRLCPPHRLIPTKMINIPAALIFRALACLPTTYLVPIHPLCFISNRWKRG